MRPDGGKIESIELLRVAACAAIVILHAAAIAMGHLETASRAQWWTAVFVNAATRWALPVFVMISGSLLLAPKRDEPMGDFLRRKVGRIMAPLIFWALFYSAWTAYKDGY